MTHFKPLSCSNLSPHRPPRAVTLRRWGSSISLSLVCFACGGVADLQLGQDSSALESGGPQGANGDVPSPFAIAPSPGTPVPAGVYLVDPATGLLYAPCGGTIPGAANDVPLSPRTPVPDGEGMVAVPAPGTPVPEDNGLPAFADDTPVPVDDGTPIPAEDPTPVPVPVDDGTPISAEDPTPVPVPVDDGTPVPADGTPDTPAVPCVPVGYVSTPTPAPSTEAAPSDGTPTTPQLAPATEEPEVASPARASY